MSDRLTTPTALIIASNYATLGSGGYLGQPRIKSMRQRQHISGWAGVLLAAKFGRMVL